MDGAHPFPPDEPMFPREVGADAAGIPYATYRQYTYSDRAPLTGRLQDGLSFRLGVGGVRRGMPGLLTWRGVLAYAAMTPLVRIGVPLHRAQLAALLWTHRGWLDEADHGEAPREISPSAIHPEPWITVLLHREDGDAILAVRSSKYGVVSLVPPVLFARPPLASVVVDLTAIYDRCTMVCRAFSQIEGR